MCKVVQRYNYLILIRYDSFDWLILIRYDSFDWLISVLSYFSSSKLRSLKRSCKKCIEIDCALEQGINQNFNTYFHLTTFTVRMLDFILYLVLKIFHHFRVQY
jgi:hypothetical protein